MAYQEIKCIYAIEQISTGKKYIGSTKNFLKRKDRHLRDLRKNQHHNIYLQRLYNKYGENDIDVYPLFHVFNEEYLFLFEQIFIDGNKNSLNIGSVSGGDNLTKNPNKEEIIKRRTQTIIKNN